MTEAVRLSLIWGTVLGAVLCSLIWAVAWYSVATKRAAMGFVQMPFVTETGAYWVKPDDLNK